MIRNSIYTWSPPINILYATYWSWPINKPKKSYCASHIGIPVPHISLTATWPPSTTYVALKSIHNNLFVLSWGQWRQERTTTTPRAPPSRRQSPFHYIAYSPQPPPWKRLTHPVTSQLVYLLGISLRHHPPHHRPPPTTTGTSILPPPSPPPYRPKGAFESKSTSNRGAAMPRHGP